MFNQIQYFVSVVKNHNFTKAAEECHISQPAISQQIKELENFLGVRLIERSGRSFKVTKAGEYFYQHGQDILANVFDLVRETKKISQRSKNVYIIHVGYLQSFGTTDFLRAVSEFSKQYPDVQIKLSSGGHEKLYQELKQDKLDFVFSDLRRAPSNLYVNDFLTSSTYEAIVNENTFQKQVAISNDELRDLPCILITNKQGAAQEKQYYRDFLGVKSQFLLASTYDEAAMMVAAGQGFLLLNNRTSHQVNTATLKNLIWLDGKRKVKQNYYAFWKASNSGYYIESFAQMLKKQFSLDANN